MSATNRPDSWHVTARLEELRGERRANGLRVLGVAVFYAIEVLNFRGLTLGPLVVPRVAGVDASFHLMATALAVAWMAVAAAVFLALANRVFPPALKYVSSGADALLLTAVLTLADGPRSPVLVAYFLLVALAGLRLSVRLVVVSTVAAIAGYLFTIGEVLERRPELRVPPHWVITTVAALALTGLVVAQIVRGARRAAEEYTALEQREPRS